MTGLLDDFRNQGLRVLDLLLGALLFLNLVASLGSAFASVLAFRRPQSLSRSVALEAGERFYASMYTARSAPFGLLAGTLPLWTAGAPVVAVLLVAAVIQFADVLIALTRRERGMIVGASVASMVHLAAAAAVFGHER